MNVVILALELIATLLALAPRLRAEWEAVIDLLETARDEGRDLTDAELDGITARARAATAALLATDPEDRT